MDVVSPTRKVKEVSDGLWRPGHGAVSCSVLEAIEAAADADELPVPCHFGTAREWRVAGSPLARDCRGMMFEALIFLAAAAAPAPSAPEPSNGGPDAIETAPAVNPAIIEMTYNAFVAVEETPVLDEIVRPAVAATPDKPRAIDLPAGTAWIS